MKSKYLSFKNRIADESAKQTLLSAVAFGVPIAVGAGVGTHTVSKLVAPYLAGGAKSVVKP
jgi:hypothetical protein